MSAQRTRVTAVARDDLLATATERHGRFQVSGFAGSGHSLLADIGGEAVFLGKDLTMWSSPALILMRQTLTPPQIELVTAWGVPDAYETVRQLPFGHCLLIERA